MCQLKKIEAFLAWFSSICDLIGIHLKLKEDDDNNDDVQDEQNDQDITKSDVSD